MKARMLMATAMAAATACAGGLSLREGDVTCGFRVKEIREMPDLSGRLWRMEYAKNGADLVWLETEDMNKTFAIAFKTLPEDDTGVAHIIEHSLLCGSVKYPVKEPFVELLKSSLATYINASTSSDCTMYPVCSRNDRDLLNLAGVYLDAVFDPLSVTNDWAMPQERNVVCNEMKGAMSSPYSIAYREMAKMLFPDNAYSSNSGGDPDAVPTLTAEAYRAFYRKFYHPSNARIFLFGKMDVPPMLELVSSYLGRYDRRDPAADPPAQPPVASAREIEYPCDSAADRVRLCEGWAFGTWRDADMTAAMDVLCDLLAGGNDAPLKKALLDAGVCEDVEMWCLDGFQNVVNLTLVNVRDGRLDEARRIVRGTLEAQVRGGFDADRISAKLDQMEFRLRERDSNQLGLAYMRTALTGWLHGGNPAERLEFSSRLAELRSRNGTGYFEKLFSDAVLSNKHHATLVMKPRTGSKPSAPSPAPDARAPEDLPENIAKLPRLRLADIPEKCDFPSWSVERVDGVDVVRPLVASNGIVYAALAFSVDDLSDAEMKDLPLLADALGDVPTARHDVAGLRREIESKLGSFDAEVCMCRDTVRFLVGVSFLESRAEDALRLAEEILTTSDLKAEKFLADLRGQRLIDFDHMLLSGAHTIACTHASRGFGGAMRAMELVEGLAQLDHLKRAQHGDLAALAAKVFTRRRLAASVANPPSDGFAKALVSMFPEGSAPGPGPASVAAGSSDAYPTSGSGSFTAMCSKLPDGVAYSGAFKVAARVLTLDSLWNEIRVKGGAYGGSLAVSRFGDLQFMSWRDPKPSGTFGVYAASGDALRRLVASGIDLERYKVSTLGRSEPNLTVRGETQMVFASYLSRVSAEDRQRERSEMMRTTKEDLLKFADILDASRGRAVRCAIGAADLVGGCGLGGASAE